jgi:membrane-bound lytic murein transglycosylase MltF
MTNDVARHPLRQKLPPLTLAIDLAQDAPIKWWKREDTHLFVISFTAFFIVFSTFLA